MNIAIDTGHLEQVINERMADAVRDSLRHRDILDAAASELTRQVVAEALADATREAVKHIDRDGLVTTLTKEITRAVSRAVLAIVEDGVVALVARIRRLDEYSHLWTPAARQALRVELFGKESESP